MWLAAARRAYRRLHWRRRIFGQESKCCAGYPHDRIVGTRGIGNIITAQEAVVVNRDLLDGQRLTFGSGPFTYLVGGARFGRTLV